MKRTNFYQICFFNWYCMILSVLITLWHKITHGKGIWYNVQRWNKCVSFDQTGNCFSFHSSLITTKLLLCDWLQFSYFAMGSFLTLFLQNCQQAAPNQNDTDEFWFPGTIFFDDGLAFLFHLLSCFAKYTFICI